MAGNRASAIIRRPARRAAVLALGVALLAARHEISFCRLAASNDGNQMIHRQIRRREFPAAMVADSRGAFALPPLAGAKLARLLPLAANLLPRKHQLETATVPLTIFSLVPTFQILQVNTKAERDKKIQCAPRHRPSVVAVGISIQLPQAQKRQRKSSRCRSIFCAP